jgi:hypothetical protein
MSSSFFNTAGFAYHCLVLVRQHGRDVHSSGVVPGKKRLVGLLGVVAVEKVDDLGGNFLVNGLRSVERQRSLVLARLFGTRAVGRRTREHRARRCQADGSLGVHGAGNFGHAGDRGVLARRRESLLARGLVDVREAYPLHRIKVVQVAPKFLEAVRGWQRVGMVAQMVLAELAGVIAEI